MKLNKLTSAILALTLVFALSGRAAADVVETSEGARIVGKITSIHAGVVSITTKFAGDLKIKQSSVTSIATDQPLAVRLTTGTRLDGKVTTENGTVAIAGPDVTVDTSVPKISAMWAAGQIDPDVIALRRHWSYEADVDIEGQTGNTNALGTDVGLKATLTSPNDVLAFSTEYDRQVTDGAKSADQFKAAVDYSNNFTDRNSWYMRDVGGFDRVMDIDFYDIAAVGMGYDLVKQPKQTFTVRLGLAYRYDDYSEAADTPLLSSAGADIGYEYSLKLKTSLLTDKFSVVPAFDNFSNFVISHEFAYEIPLANPAWKLKIGVSNDYESLPPTGLQKLDTIYFTRLVLNWGQ